MTQKTRGLGRGLSALLPTEPEGIRTVALSQLVPNQLQPRTSFDEAAIEELAESIRSQGLLQPIIVSPLDSKSYMILAGERRWRAAERAGLATVPVVVKKVDGARERLVLALVENLQREDLNPLEEAEAYRALAESHGLSHEEIARRVGKSRASISNALRLLRLPASVLELLRSGRLSASQVRPLLALEDPAEIERLALLAAEQGTAAHTMESIVREGSGRKRRAKSAPEPNTAAAAEKLTQRLQTKVEIERRGRGGVIRIHYHSEEELMRLFDEISSR